MNCDFLLEKKLEKESPELARIFKNNVLCCQNMLIKYRSVFPGFTDHSALHSLEVIAFANSLIGDNIGRLNVDEIFVLLMAAYLHDAGMGINENDYEEFCPKIPGMEVYRQKNPGADMAETIRTFHNEFSGLYIRKYAGLFDFPSDAHLEAVVQVSRGHRKTNLYDINEYPVDLKTPQGAALCLPYLAALIRLADELDIAADRNLLFMYDSAVFANELSRMEFMKHKAVRRLTIEKDRFLMEVDASDPAIREALAELGEKVNETLNYCSNVVERRTDFRILQNRVDIEGILC